MSRPQLADIERLHPSGAYWLPCDGSCEEYRRGLTVMGTGHTFYFYTKREVLARWRDQHPRGGGRND